MAGLFVLGGSSYYTLLLLQSLKAAGVLPRLTRIALFGRDAARLALIAEAGETLVDGAVRIEATTRLEDCLPEDFDILFNQIRFGGLGARDGDERLALDVGLPADETIGVVGVSNAIRAVIGMQACLPVLRRKPQSCRFVNFTNPCSILCQYLTQTLAASVIGVCDYPAYMRREIARRLDAPAAALALDYVGLNHFGFIHGVRSDGREILPELIGSGLPFEPACNRWFDTLLNVSWTFVFEAEHVAERQRSQANRASALLKIERECDRLLMAGIRDPGAYLAVLAERNCDWYNLAVAPLMAQLVGLGGEELFLNCAVGDALDLGLSSTIIETGCTIDVQGVNPREIPAWVRRSEEFAMVRMGKVAEMTLLDGILMRDPRKIMRACLVNPMIGDLARVETYFERLGASDPLIGAIWSGA